MSGEAPSTPPQNRRQLGCPGAPERPPRPQGIIRTGQPLGRLVFPPMGEPSTPPHPVVEPSTPPPYRVNYHGCPGAPTPGSSAGEVSRYGGQPVGRLDFGDDTSFIDDGLGAALAKPE